MKLSKTLWTLLAALVWAVPAAAIYTPARSVTFPFPIEKVIVGRDGTFWASGVLLRLDESGPGRPVVLEERLTVMRYRIGDAAPTVVFNLDPRNSDDPPTYTVLNAGHNLAGTDAAGNLAFFFYVDHVHGDDGQFGNVEVHYVRFAADGGILKPDGFKVVPQSHPYVPPDWSLDNYIFLNGNILNREINQLLSPDGGRLTGSITASPELSDWSVIREFDDGRYVLSNAADALQVYAANQTPIAPVRSFTRPSVYQFTSVAANSVGGGVLSNGNNSYQRFNANGDLVGARVDLSTMFGASVFALADNGHVFFADSRQLREFDENDAPVTSGLFDLFPTTPTDYSAAAVNRYGDVLAVERTNGYLYAAPRCGDKTIDASLSEECDDGNTTDLDGCAADCTIQVCGNSTIDSGEGCDDGNLVGDDGCDALCRKEDEITATTPAGVPVSTDPENDGATPGDPLEVALTSPSGGAVSLVETSAPSSSAYSILGQQVEITAPDETALNPLVIALRIDRSLAPSAVDSIQIFRNSVMVADCADASGQANPDPCVASRVLQDDGDVVVTALSSHASTWLLGLVCGDGKLCTGPGCTSGPTGGSELCDDGPANSDTGFGTCRTTCALPRCGDNVIDPGEVCDDGNVIDGDGCSSTCTGKPAKDFAGCLNTVAKSGGGGLMSAMGLVSSCVKQALADGSDPATCVDGDADGDLAKALGKFSEGVAKKCTVTPRFGYGGAAAGTTAITAAKNLLEDIFGTPPKNALSATWAECQNAMAKKSLNIAKAAAKAFQGCVKSGIKTGSITRPSELAACVPAFSTFTKAKDKLDAAYNDKCNVFSADADLMFPGCIGVGVSRKTCLAGRALCRICTGYEQMHGFDVDCDALAGVSCGS